jgi:periplasmic copper chaperone A
MNADEMPMSSGKWICGCLLLGAGLEANAAVTATDAWVRGTVPAQKTTGAFVTLTSTDDAKVVGVASPAAKVVEIHAMDNAGGVMRMHAIDALALPAGKPVALAGSGYHVMLIDLTRPLKTGDTVPLTFTIVDSHGRRQSLEVKAPVRPLVP